MNNFWTEESFCQNHYGDKQVCNCQIYSCKCHPDSLAPHIDKEENGEESSKKLPLLSEEKQNQLFDKIDLSGTAKWSPKQREQVRQLFIEFGSIFALDSLDLGKTSIVKHKI